MPRYRMEFSKKGPARFISHLDLVRTLERVMRRAGLPLAFSQGFNPHPRFSLGAPLPVGVSGEREYLDLELTAELPSGEVCRRMMDKLPRGLEVVRVWRIPDNSPALMAVIERATYRVKVALEREISPEELQKCIDDFLAVPNIIVNRRTKEGKEKAVNIRPGIYNLSGRVEGQNVALEMALQIGSGGNVRPEEVVRMLAEKCGLPAAADDLDIVRTGLYPIQRM